jgi:hypothetical protein
MPTLNDLAIAADEASLAYDRNPTPVRGRALLDARNAYEAEVRAIDARQRAAIARAQAVAS